MPSPRSAANPASHPSLPREHLPGLLPVAASRLVTGLSRASCRDAGDICVRAADKPRLLAELRRMLRPGGQVGFSDLVFDRPPAAAEDRALRALLYHSARELLTDWPGLFAAAGFQLGTVRDIQAQTLPTWQHVQAVYRQHAAQTRVLRPAARPWYRPPYRPPGRPGRRCDQTLRQLPGAERDSAQHAAGVPPGRASSDPGR